MITDTRAELAIRYLAESDLQCAELKADMERREFKAKSLKHTAFLHMTGTVAEREAGASTHADVIEAYTAYFDAIKQYNAVANKRSTEELILQIWRTTQANRRQGSI